MIHKDACVEGFVGTNTKVWRWSHIASTGDVGDDCMIGQGCYIAGKVGDRCKIQNGCQVFFGVEIADDVFLGPNVVFTNVRYPMAAKVQGALWRTIVENRVSIGANATILCGVEIGAGAIVGAGAVVVRDVPENTTVVGNPARIIKLKNR